MQINNGHNAGSDPLAFLAGGGDMGKLIRAFDWSRTPLGSIDSWPGSLRTTVSICLASDLPICIVWGPGLVQIYNDGYRLICGDKHPRSLGQNFPECWREAWPVIGDAHDSALSGDTAFLEKQCVFLDRYGYTEECFFTFSFSPIRDEAGEVGGLFHPVIEMTAEVQGERRTRALRDVAAQTANATTVNDACALAASALAAHEHDVPFALLYLLSSDGQSAHLSASVGIAAAEDTAAEHAAMLARDWSSWPVTEVAQTGQSQVVTDVENRFGRLLCGPYPECPRLALALPLRSPGSERPLGVLITGVSSRLTLTSGYRDFHELLAATVTAAVVNGRAFDDERRKAEGLAELDRAKTAFFSNVSHEFRTPLTLMLGPVEELRTLDDSELSAATKRKLDIVERNGQRLLRLVNTLLDFSRLEAGRAHASFQPTDLAAFTADLASVFRAACERVGLALIVDCPPLSEPVFVDREMWEKVILNLLSNAFKFTFEGEIAVTLASTGRAVELRVRDSGTGIPPAEMPRLFERFHRIENARGRTHEGSGIGLSMVQELVTLHGGTITAESVVDRGTAIIVIIPLGSAHLPADQLVEESTYAVASIAASPFVEEALLWLPGDGVSARSAFLPNMQNETSRLQTGAPDEDDVRPHVLVADDNADMRQYVTRLLAEHFHVESVPDGEAALQSARERVPDLVLTDVMMPRLDGFGLLNALRKDPRTSSVPVIMLSARAGEESRVDGMDAGADDYLVKPFAAKELLARVKAHLQMAQLRRDSIETLRQGEERLRMALTAARMVAWELDVATGVIVLSTNAAEIFRLDPGQTLELFEPAFDVVHADDVDGHRAIVTNVVAEGGSYISQFRLRACDNGAPVWLEDRGHAVIDDTGQIRRLVGVVMDITLRKLADEEIRAGEEKIRTILESIADGFYALDADWRFTYVNSAAERMLNRVHGDLIGKVVWEEYSSAIGSDFERVYRRVAADRVAESFTTFYPDFDRWYEVSAYPASVGLTVYFRDVTAERSIEKRLISSEERRRLALDDAELGAWNLDPVTMSLNMDNRCRAIFGFPVDSMDLSDAIPVVHPGDEVAVREALIAAIRPENPLPYAIEYRIVHRDESVHWVFAKGRTQFEGSGPTRRAVSFDGTVADITDRKLAEEERESLVSQLRQQDMRKDEFLATLAHELRNPLAPISNGLQMIKLAGSTGKVERVRLMMERQLTQMVRLVDDLLDASRITHGKLELQTARTDLKAVIDTAVEIAMPLIDQADHQLSVSLPTDAIFVEGDVTRLAQVVSNLLTNSAKYTHKGGRIRLTVSRTANMVSISVLDNGIGLPETMLERVFEMFTQVDRTLEKTTRGLGIGLSLAKGLVEMHGGTIEARSDGEGRGSEFVVHLPIAAAAAHESHKGGTRGDRMARTGGHRIVVVDDNEDAADSLAQLLTLSGNEVRVAHDGEAGIAEAESFQPDVVLLDIGMPKLNGYDVCRRIRAQEWGRDMMLVAMTGWGQAEDQRRSHDAGFDAHLVKPVAYDLLQDLLARAPRSETNPVRAPLPG